jgi:Zn-dependent membrane protease YugP
MHLLILGGLVLLIVLGPSLWVKRVMKKHSTPADRYQGSGAELARHLLDQLDMQQVGVEQTDQGDHYDPIAKVVRLSQDNYESHSLTAVTVAAHEVGHAIQDHQGYPPLRWRHRLVGWAGPAEKLAAGILIASPFVSMVTLAPVAGVVTFLVGFLFLGLMPVLHLVTLPVELDASFARALPMLTKGKFLKAGDELHARRILTAAACTYVAVSLMSLLNIARWVAIIRR